MAKRPAPPAPRGIVKNSCTPTGADMTCCNHNCRQGRDCPNRRPQPVLLAVVLVAALALIWHIAPIATAHVSAPLEGMEW
jgi:hypothetical protein